MDQKAWTESRYEWIDMDKKMFYAAPDLIQVESRNKWYSLYPDKVYPLDNISTSKKESRPSKKPTREVSAAPCWAFIFELLFHLIFL